jgi:hypothetical protein
MHYSKEYENAPMPDSIVFTKGDAIHEFTDTPFSVAVSHGCVRLSRRQRRRTLPACETGGHGECHYHRTGSGPAAAAGCATKQTDMGSGVLRLPQLLGHDLARYR